MKVLRLLENMRVSVAFFFWARVARRSMVLGVMRDSGVRGVGSGEGDGAARRVVGARARRVVNRRVSFILMSWFG